MNIENVLSSIVRITYTKGRALSYIRAIDGCVLKVLVEAFNVLRRRRRKKRDEGDPAW